MIDCQRNRVTAFVVVSAISVTPVVSDKLKPTTSITLILAGLS